MSPDYIGLTSGPYCLSFSFSMTSEGVQLIVMAKSPDKHVPATLGIWTYDQQTHYPNLTQANVSISTGVKNIVFVADKFYFTFLSHYINLDNILLKSGSCNLSGNYEQITRYFNINITVVNVQYLSVWADLAGIGVFLVDRCYIP